MVACRHVISLLVFNSKRNSTKSVVWLLFASAVLLLFKSFSIGPGYATNCKLVSISSSFVYILVVVIFVLRYLY